MAYLARVKVWIAGEVLYAADLNAEFDNICNSILPVPSGEAQGDLIIRSGSQWVRLAAGTNGYWLQTKGSGADPEWTSLSPILIPGSSVQGDILYHNGTIYTRLAAGTVGQVLKTGGPGASPSWISANPVAVWTRPGTLAVERIAPRLYVPFACTIVKAYATIYTAPTGQAAIFDIHKGGVSIWATTPANRVQIAAGAYTGTQTSFDTVTLAEGDQLDAYIDQVGSSAAGADLTIQLKVAVS